MAPIPAALAQIEPRAALLAAEAAQDKSGVDTVVLDMSESLGVVDAFVITSGRNTRQVRTIVEEVERRLKQPAPDAFEASGGPQGAAADGDGRPPISVEGLDDARWVLMDYGDFVVHVFLEEARDYYDLEHLWSRAPRLAPDAAPRGAVTGSP